MKQIKKLIAKLLLIAFFFQIFWGVNFSQASGNTRPTDINVTNYNIPFDSNNPPTGEVAIGKIQAEAGVSYKIFLGNGGNNFYWEENEKAAYCRAITSNDMTAKLNADNEIMLWNITKDNAFYTYYLAIIATNADGASIVKSFAILQHSKRSQISHMFINRVFIHKNLNEESSWYYNNRHNDCFM